jgi:hypothetical protein
MRGIYESNNALPSGGHFLCMDDSSYICKDLESYFGFKGRVDSVVFVFSVVYRSPRYKD